MEEFLDDLCDAPTDDDMLDHVLANRLDAS